MNSENFSKLSLSSIEQRPRSTGGSYRDWQAPTMTVSTKSMASPPTKQSSADVDEEATHDIIPVHQWEVQEVLNWASNVERCTDAVVYCLRTEGIDGEVLMALTEDDIRDFRYKLNYKLTFSELKKLWLSVHALQLQHGYIRKGMSITSRDLPNGAIRFSSPDASPLHHLHATREPTSVYGLNASVNGDYTEGYPINRCAGELNSSAMASSYCENITPPMSVDGRATNIPNEFFKTAISLGYSFLVTWITSFVMVIVHERVPDMKRYPPLPDIFLDNVPHIPWAFHMCEITGTLLFTIWSCVCIFHRYRMVLLRRFFALAGTVFLLRCVTMLITSLSVPGTHLQCNQNDYAVDDTELTVAEALELRISRAYTIWSGLGMSIQGVRTCGDYMFSGHTVALTLLNFFITEYTPRNLYFLHTLTWLLNMFGIFFILAAHEHYSIDVFVAFYITSRLFLYYHTLANNQALMSRDSNRTRIWFPMFSYFENSVNGIIPNEFDSVGTLLDHLFTFVLSMKDSCMLTARRYWLDPNSFVAKSKNALFVPYADIKQKNVATSTRASACVTPTTMSSHTIFNDAAGTSSVVKQKEIMTAVCNINAKTTEEAESNEKKDI